MSEETIVKYKVGHRSIIDCLDQNQVLSRSYLEAKPKIREMQEKLMVHFSSQGDELFNKLLAHHQSNRESMKIIEFLKEDLKHVKVKFLIFFEKHSGEMSDMNSRSYPKDLYDFSQEILARLKIEEDYLFPLLKEI